MKKVKLIILSLLMLLSMGAVAQTKSYTFRLKILTFQHKS